MKYTRLEPKREMVTFTVSFIAEPVTVPSMTALPLYAVMRAVQRQDMSAVFAMLDDELEVILNAANIREINEFNDAWNKASEEAEEKSRQSTSFLKRMFGGDPR